MTALVVAGMSAREISRRRAALVLVISLPLWFYLARRDLTGQSVRMLLIGIAWAVSTLTLFVINSSRGVDPRLRVSGASVPGIVGGRLVAMSGFGILLATCYTLLVVVDQNIERNWAVAVMMLITAVVAVPFGSLVGALFPRELEGALGLFSVCAVQMLADPAGTLAKFLPFWSGREIGTYAIDGTGSEMLWRGLGHGVLVWLLCTGLTLAIFARRLRLARYPEPHH
ncbi:MAG TPA: hypothetical protein VN408_00765 [Actinoplanes sp.]|nr:hypothetical protein [Actinoplanes sp.]